MEDNVLAGDIGLELTMDIDLDGRRNLEPVQAGRHAGSHIRRSDTRRKGAQCPVSAGVRIRTDGQVTGNDKALFRQQGVLHTYGTHIKEVGDMMLTGKVAGSLT